MAPGSLASREDTADAEGRSHAGVAAGEQVDLGRFISHDSREQFLDVLVHHHLLARVVQRLSLEQLTHLGAKRLSVDVEVTLHSLLGLHCI